MSNRNLGTAVCLALYDKDLEDGKTARWTLMPASSDQTHIRVVNSHYITHEAWAKLLVVFLPQSSSRAQAFWGSLVKMNSGQREDPQGSLTQLDDLTRADSESSKEEEGMGLVWMMSVEQASAESLKAAVVCPRGMILSGSRVSDALAGCGVVCHVNCALVADGKEDDSDALVRAREHSRSNTRVIALQFAGIRVPPGTYVIIVEARTSTSLGGVEMPVQRRISSFPS